MAVPGWTMNGPGWNLLPISGLSGYLDLSAYGWSWLIGWPLAGPWLAHGCHKSEYDWALMSTGGIWLDITWPRWPALAGKACYCWPWLSMAGPEWATLNMARPSLLFMAVPGWQFSAVFGWIYMSGLSGQMAGLAMKVRMARRNSWEKNTFWPCLPGNWSTRPHSQLHHKNLSQLGRLAANKYVPIDPLQTKKYSPYIFRIHRTSISRKSMFPVNNPACRV